MAKIEIDETALQQYGQLANFVKQALENPETRSEVLKIQKKLNPKTHIPELDAQDKVSSALDEIKKTLADERAERAKEREEAETAKARAALESKWTKGQEYARESGYSEEGLGKLEEFMQAEGIASHQHAMAAFEKLHPRPETVASNANPFAARFPNEMRNEDSTKKLFSPNKADQSDWLRQTVNETLGRRVM